ncbi:MAG: GNAT family N-acetyltransferase [Anaerovoracaceae bacterium]
MKEIIAYEMSFNGPLRHTSDIACVPFEEMYWNEYMQIYNDCFYTMRKELEIEPFNYYSDFAQFAGKLSNTFLYIHEGKILGSVSCCEHEIDDLIVAREFHGNGIGTQLLLWGMSHIRARGFNEITLHVAEWNSKAVSLYLKNGFSIVKKERVR